MGRPRAARRLGNGPARPAPRPGPQPEARSSRHRLGAGPDGVEPATAVGPDVPWPGPPPRSAPSAWAALGPKLRVAQDGGLGGLPRPLKARARGPPGAEAAKRSRRGKGPLRTRCPRPQRRSSQGPALGTRGRACLDETPACGNPCTSPGGRQTACTHGDGVPSEGPSLQPNWGLPEATDVQKRGPGNCLCQRWRRRSRRASSRSAHTLSTCVQGRQCSVRNVALRIAGPSAKLRQTRRAHMDVPFFAATPG